MKKIWGSLASIFIFMELVYHICCFGFSGGYFFYTIILVFTWAMVESFLIGLTKGKLQKFLYFLFVWFPIFWTAVEIVYYRIFRQPLLLEAIVKGGEDALTNYWREALDGIVAALPYLGLITLPGIVVGVLVHKDKIVLTATEKKTKIRLGALSTIGIGIMIVVMQMGRVGNAEFYETYSGFFDPLTIAEEMGVFPMLQRDVNTNIVRIFSGFCEEEIEDEEEVLAQNEENGQESEDWLKQQALAQKTEEPSAEQMKKDLEDNSIENEEGEETAVFVPEDHVFDLDFEVLAETAKNKKQKWLAEYLSQLKPTTTNEYTGIFEGYNLIFLTAEGFSPYAVRKDLTPTLYRLVNSGFVFDNYYVPLWQTSTSDGEYINCTGLIPNGQFSMKKSAKNNMAFTLAHYFGAQDVKTIAYHNNSLNYYDRYITHANLGYDFRAAKLGGLSKNKWGDSIFPMEHPQAWPASDLEMMQGSVPQYIGEERFHVYYMTVSGHMNYNFKGNEMSMKNKDAVKDLDLSENARAYIACNIELDKALENLLKQLEEAGKLENTVICLSADHYPYAMTEDQYEELAGKDLSQGMDKFRSNLILWNAGLEDKTVHIKKVCGSMDLLPTLLNLFGFTYDSRMYAGKDIFSEEEGMVIFNDKSFVTDSCTFRKKGKNNTIWNLDENGNYLIPEEEQKAYLEAMKEEVNNRYQFSAYVLEENYYQKIIEARK